MKCNFLKIDANGFGHLWKYDISRHYAATFIIINDQVSQFENFIVFWVDNEIIIIVAFT